MGFTLVLVVSLLGVSLYVRYAAEREIERYQQEVERARAERIQWIVNRYYENNEDLSGIGPALEQAQWLYNWNIEVTDAEGQPIALVSGKKTVTEPPTRQWIGPSLRQTSESARGTWCPENTGRRPEVRQAHIQTARQ